MSFAAPLFLLLGLGLAGGVVALHLLARRTPRARDLPTVRFVPERQVSAPAPTVPPSDLWLLILRVAAVMLLSVAFARPSVESRDGTRRVILVDRSAGVASVAEVLDSVTRLVGPRDVVFAFDTVAVRVEALDDLEGSGAPGSLTAALVTGVRAAAGVMEGADSLELVVVSPFVREEWDSATTLARAQWPGRARMVRVAAAAPPGRGVQSRIADDDPLAATLASRDLVRPGAAVRLLREAPSASDSLWAHETGGAVVSWRRSFGGMKDTVGAVTFGDAVVVAEWERPDIQLDGRPVGWWVDGTPAAVERVVGAGCVREVAVPIPAVGDVVLRPSFGELVERATGPCGGARDVTPVADSLVGRLAGGGPLAHAGAMPRPRSAPVPADVWLLAGAIAVLLVEPLVRRRAS